MTDGAINNKDHFIKAARSSPAQRRPGCHQIIKDGVTQPGYATVIPGRKRVIHDENPHRFPGGHRSIG